MIIELRLSLTCLVVAALATPNLILAISSIPFWRHQRPDTRPAVSAFSKRYAGELLSSGALFFVIQLAGTVAFASDPLILAHVLGPGAVAGITRIFGFLIFAVAVQLVWDGVADFKQ